MMGIPLYRGNEGLERQAAAVLDARRARTAPFVPLADRDRVPPAKPLPPPVRMRRDPADLAVKRATGPRGVQYATGLGAYSKGSKTARDHAKRKDPARRTNVPPAMQPKKNG